MVRWNLQTQLVLHKSVADSDDYNSNMKSFSCMSTSFLFGSERADFQLKNNREYNC
jgi:hypothetical protein